MLHVEHTGRVDNEAPICVRPTTDIPPESLQAVGNAWLTKATQFIRQHKVMTLLASALCISIVALAHEALHQRLAASVFMVLGLTFSALAAHRIAPSTPSASAVPPVTRSAFRAALPALLTMAGMFAACQMALDAIADALQPLLQNGNTAKDMSQARLLTNVILLPLTIPLTSAVWLAPFLIINRKAGAIEAVRASFIAGLRHVRLISFWGRAYLVWLVGSAVLVVAVSITSQLQAAYPVAMTIFLIPAAITALALVVTLPAIAFLSASAMALDLFVAPTPPPPFARSSGEQRGANCPEFRSEWVTKKSDKLI